MRALLILLLVSSTALFAADKTPEEIREEARYKWQVTKNWETIGPEARMALADEFAAVLIESWNQYKVNQLAVMTAACPSGTDCVTTEQKNILDAQVRIAIGLVTAKTKWIKEGKTAAEQKTAEENFNNCASQNTDCDKLPETERNSAREARGSTAVVVTPDTSVADEIKAGDDKIVEDLQAIANAYNEANPGWSEVDLTKAGRDHLVNIMTLRLDKKLAMLAELCTKHPGNAEVCLTPEAISALRDELAGNSCKIDRQMAKKSATLDNHATQWAGLAAPKSCQTLIALDAGATVTPDTDTTPVVVEEEDDEKSPRNYKAETCKWVTDLPRKIVNGPSCGKTRSQICTGYVVCEQKVGGGKFIRMSTCGPGKCGATDEDAVNCTKDQGYWSKKPASESKLFMSKKLKDILSGNEAQ